jgi:Protein of unknown function (DUF3800)
LAGYLAPAAEWALVSSAWRQLLEQKGLTEFKTRNCHAAEGEFKGRNDRIETREAFFAVMDKANVDAFAVRIDMKTFDDVRNKLDSSIRPGFNKAYLHGMSALLQFMTELVRDQPKDELINFVFDEQDEFRGRALEVFEAIKRMSGIAIRSERLGSITFGNSRLLPPLQAADSLAYRVHRDHFHSAPRQRSVVHATARVRVALLGGDAVPDQRDKF